jgi:hypothetical protein
MFPQASVSVKSGADPHSSDLPLCIGPSCNPLANKTLLMPKLQLQVNRIIEF